ncbi:MAG TPA: hypothetical protein VHM90_06315 [Phycisphaerae bacterium]|jgi:hypothetical protein|nr:hypothetical protein [Phycisphaerae bacterium]
MPNEAGFMQLAKGGKDFKELLKKAEDATSPEEKARKAQRAKETDQAATGLVANALILPILQQVRRSMQEMKGPFSPGKGENAFGPQFDIQLADRIAQSPKLGIKTALVNRLSTRGTPVHGRDARVKQDLDVHG